MTPQQHQHLNYRCYTTMAMAVIRNVIQQAVFDYQKHNFDLVDKFGKHFTAHSVPCGVAYQIKAGAYR